MAGGIQGVQGHVLSSRVSFSATGGIDPAGGPSIPLTEAPEGGVTPAPAAAERASSGAMTTSDYCGLCKALAERGPTLTDDERAAFNAARAREMAKAEARRHPGSPQGDLLEAA